MATSTNNSARLAERVQAVLRVDPARGAIEQNGQWWSWGQLAQLMQDVDAMLTSRGLGIGTPVGMLLRNRPAHLGALLQVLISGRCVVTINPFQSADKLAADLSALRCPVYIADEQDWQLEPVRAAAGATGSIALALSNAESLTVATVPPLASLGTGPHHEPLPGIGIQMLTSGTTGPAKRVKLAYKNLERALLDALFYEAGARDGQVALKNAVVLMVQPLVHIGGVWGAVSAVIAGRGIVLFEKFTVHAWHAAVKAHRPKLVALPPTALKMILDANVPKEDLASIIAVRSGTAPLGPELQKNFEERYGIPILNAYGATEFAGGVAGWTLDDYKRVGAAKRGSVGRAQPGCELRIVDRETLEPLPANAIGLLEVKAKHVGDGEWLRTTDLAELDSDGFLYIRGRADDAIIRGGFKILPGDVASVFLRHPSVKDASVIGLPDERLGAVPVAALELHADAARPSEEELLALARKHLVSYQVPVALKIVSELPRTPSLKVSQPGVRALFEGDHSGTP